jgi:tRNA 2-thiouridine synthesizing protein A
MGANERMEELDLRGLKCPLPAMMARKRLATLPAGESVWVLASDP